MLLDSSFQYIEWFAWFAPMIVTVFNFLFLSWLSFMIFISIYKILKWDASSLDPISAPKETEMTEEVWEIELKPIIGSPTTVIEEINTETIPSPKPTTKKPITKKIPTKTKK
jgi:hypothetical protein